MFNVGVSSYPTAVGIIVWSVYSLSTTLFDLLDRLAVAFNKHTFVTKMFL